MDINELIERPPRVDPPVELVAQVLARLPDRTRSSRQQRIFSWVMLGAAVALGLVLGQILNLPLGDLPRLPALPSWQDMITLHLADAVVAFMLLGVLAGVLGRRSVA